MTITIDPEVIAAEMVLDGIRPQDIKAGEFEGWTDSFADHLALLETAVKEAICKLPDVIACPDCGGVDWDWQDDTKICNNCHLEF